MPLLFLGMLGVGAYLWWTSRPSSPAPLPVATSPNLYVASSEQGYAPVPLPSGLAAGWYWQDQGNQAIPYNASTVKALAMSPDDVAYAVYGTVLSSDISGATVTFSAIAQVPANSQSGAYSGQQITLPLSYVEAA